MNELKAQYKKILEDYILNQTERNLYIGQNFVRQLIQKKVEPEEVICIHKEVLLDLYPELQEVTENSLNFLIEIMIHLSLMLKEQSLLETQEGV
jgi:phosphoserine phosphatase RsbU/P